MSVQNNSLYNACRDGVPATVKCYLKFGCDVNMRFAGMTPLITAIYNNHPKVVTLLLSCKDLDIAVADGGGMTGLHNACWYNNAGCIAMLGADSRMTEQELNRKDSFGRTALMVAITRGNLVCVKEMAKLEGVDWENKDGESLEDVARRLKKDEILTFLCERKRDTSKKMRLTKLAEQLENLETLEDDMEAELIFLDDNQTVELVILNDKHEQEIKYVQEKFKKRKEDLEGIIRKEEKSLALLLLPEIQSRLNSPAPECPICLESMAPPIRLYNCPEGHLVCEECKPKVDICSLCRKPFHGRATAMEQYLRAQLGLQ